MLQLAQPATSDFLARSDTPNLIADRVRAEFREMPGLALTLAQAGRLWNMDATTCADVLSQLVGAGFLFQRPDGAFCREN